MYGGDIQLFNLSIKRKKDVGATKKFIIDLMTGRVDIQRLIFEKLPVT